VRSVRGLGWGSVLFFASGTTGLAYEVIWFRRFAHLFGGSNLALGAVVASFLLGLGLGAHLMGPRADRAPVPLRIYAWCEIGIGLLALAIPFESALLFPLSAAVYPALESWPLLHTLCRFILTFAVIGPPCLLMGGTFPLMVRQFASPAESVGSPAGWLYAVNTGGAALGCYLSGFHLLPWLGLSGTNLLAVSANGAIALGAFLLSGRLGLPESAPEGPVGPEDIKEPRPFLPSGPPLWALYAAAALAGLSSLLLQMVWTRQLSVMLGGSTYALSSTLLVILLGIALGSLLFRGSLPWLSDPAPAAAMALGLLGLSAGASKLLIPSLSVAVGFSGALRSMALGNAAVCVGASAILELVPSLCMGFLFPLLVHMTRSARSGAGQAVGRVYAWNTGGSILGAAATAPLGLALLGSASTLALGLAFYFVSALLLLLPIRGARTGAPLGILIALALPGLILALRPLDPRRTDLGMYLYGWRDPETKTLLYFKEGASSNVMVTDHGVDRALAVNGKVDATSQGDMDMQLGIAYFPRFLRPQAQKVFVIGYGSGTTSGASLLFPGTKVTCCEIEPAVFGATTHFSQVNHSPEKNPDFRIVFDDGRSHLQGSPDVYDLILSEPSNPWIAGVGALFTREFYRTARQRLGEQGVLAQWLQLYSFSQADYALVVRTLLDSFPHACLLRISSGDTVLLASPSPILPDLDPIRASQSLVDRLPLVRADLEETFKESDVRSLLLGRLLLDEGGLGRLAAREPARTINTDQNLRLEFDAPLRLFHSDLEPESELEASILGCVEAVFLRRMVERWGCDRRQAGALRELSDLLVRRARSPQSLPVLDVGIGLDPANAELLAARVIGQKGQDEAYVRRVFPQILAGSPIEAVRVGEAIGNESKYALAVELFEAVVAAYPQSATAWENLGINASWLGAWDRAAEAFEKAISLDPLNPEIRKGDQDFKRRRSKAQAK
jgi:spermidine synthase